MNKNTKIVPQKLLDVLITQFSLQHSHPLNKHIHYFTIPLITFAILGLIWAVPFPHLDFLGRYNGFVNWASFAIAIIVYYYYRISQVLSYGILLMVFIFSAGIVGLEKLHTQSGFPEMWQMCLAILIAAYIVQLAGHKLEGRMPPLPYSLKTLLTGPLWLFYLLFRKSGVSKY